MGLAKETVEVTEYAKSLLMNSNLDDNVKKQLHNLLVVSTIATNGISVEEKILKITECIHNLAVLQVTFLQTVDAKIEKANKEKCVECKAMKHIEELEIQHLKEEIINSWKKANGLSLDEDKPEDLENDWKHIAMKLVLKPYVWILLSIVVVSPYGVEIVKSLLLVFVK